MDIQYSVDSDEQLLSSLLLNNRKTVEQEDNASLLSKRDSRGRNKPRPAVPATFYNDYVAYSSALATASNRIPPFLTVNGLAGTLGAGSARYTQADIFTALRAGVAELNRWQRSPPGSGRPSWSSTEYPHGLRGIEDALQDVNLGAGRLEDMWIFPIRVPESLSEVAWANGLRVGPDRVVFSSTGLYLGVVTHRGHTATNGFHWGSPTDGQGRALNTANMIGIPGAPVRTQYDGPVQNQVVTGEGLRDAAIPNAATNPWNVGSNIFWGAKGGGL